MNTVNASPEVVQFLSQVSGTAEIRDPQGKILGHYAPIQPDTVGEIPLKSQDRINNRSLKEVFEHLLAISPDEHRKEILRKHLNEMAEVS